MLAIVTELSFSRSVLVKQKRRTAHRHWQLEYFSPLSLALLDLGRRRGTQPSHRIGWRIALRTCQ